MVREGKRASRLYHRNVESRILGRIVDAMLAAAGDLTQATDEEWTRILVESCRRQKRPTEAANVSAH